ncbi:MAG: GNAT family N-acetyltransferase [Candidatus Colwellbacteria bacterium]|nr:GNAT family N-acetyltransferase [Candidatus Colwellbacteria bacterium]
MNNEFSTDTKIKIVTAGLGDFLKITDIQKKDGFRHAYPLTKERFRKLLQRGELFFVAFLQNQAVGIISVDMEIRAKLHFFSVIQNYWGKGIGTALLAKILIEAKKRDYKSVYVYVEIDSPVEKFLINKGFKKVGIYRNRYKQGRHAHILEISL